MAKKKVIVKKKPVAKPVPVAKKKPVVKAKVAAKPAAAVKAKPAEKAKPVAKARPNKASADIKHIAVAGNIGSGKTTLVKILSKHFGWIPHFEDLDNNPYLNDFYEDMPRWSFNLQVYFLNNRFKNILEIQKGEEVIIQDRTIYEDAMIFAPNLHSMGLMSTRDFENYSKLFETTASLIRPPDLLIYLRATVPALVNQIQKRGREYEDNLRLDYLRRLNEYYEKWIGTYNQGRLLIIDVDQLNFADEEEAQGEVINKVNAELYGLF